MPFAFLHDGEASPARLNGKFVKTLSFVNCSAMWKWTNTMTSLTLFQDARLVQYSNINWWNSPYHQSEKERSQDHTKESQKKFFLNISIKKKINYRKPGIEENFLYFIKSIYKNTSGNIMLNGKSLNALPLRLETKKGFLLSPLLF